MITFRVISDDIIVKEEGQDGLVNWNEVSYSTFYLKTDIQCHVS